jgi:hypothetical protein
MAEPKSASDWAMVMSELRKSKPRPLAKLFGRAGPSSEQLRQYKEDERSWNKLYRYASKIAEVDARG